MRQVHGNRELSVEGLVDTEEIKAVALNTPNVAEDLSLFCMRSMLEGIPLAHF